MEHVITIQNIPFKFTRRNDNSYLLLGSDYCDSGLLFFLVDNLPDNIVNIPELSSTIEILIKRYNGQ